MSGSNDLLAQTLLMQARQQRRPSAQSQLAAQMMQQSMQGGPTWGTGAGIARVVPGVLGAFLAMRAEGSDREREDEDFKRNAQYQEGQRTRDMNEIRALQGGMPGMAAPPQQAPMAPQQGEPMMPRSATPIAAEDAGAMGASAARYGSVPGRPPIGASYREPEWAAGLPPANGQMANLAPQQGMPVATPQGAPPAQQAGPTPAYIAHMQALAAGGNAVAQRMLPGLQWQYEQARRDRPEYRPISPGQSVMDPQTGQLRPGAPEEVTWGNAVDEAGPNGPIRVQYSNRGQRRVVEGSAPYQAPNVTVVDAGTSRIPIDTRTGQPVAQPIPVDVAGRERQERQGSAEGTQIAGAPAAFDVANRTLEQIDGALNHGALRGSTGALSWSAALPGTPMRDFGQRIEQLRGATFLDAIERLRGSGAITDTEGRQATAASARLDRSVSPTDFRQALTELRDLVNVGRRRAEARMPSAPSGTGANPAAPPGRARFNPQTGEIE